MPPLDSTSNLTKGLSQQLDRQKSALAQWRQGLEKYTNRQTDSLLRADADVLDEMVTNLESQHEAALRDVPVLKSPEQRAKSLLNDLELQIWELKQAENRRQLTGGGGDVGAGITGSGGGGGGGNRPWQRTDKFEKSAETEALEQVLLEIQDSADDLISKINREPPCLGSGFVQDIEALIHQNVILKTETERAHLEILRLGDEVSALREDQSHNQRFYSQLVKRLHSVSADRDALSENLRHGISQQERDEYAREIQRLHSREVNSRKEFVSKFADMQGTITVQHEKIKVLEREIERLKKVNVVQEEEFKAHVARLIRDKRALRSSNDKMNRMIFNSQRLQTKLDEELASTKKL